jgi:hypothetical protein
MAVISNIILALTILPSRTPVCFVYLDKKYNINAAEHISSDWVKEDIIDITLSVLQIVSHDNVAFCRDTC